MFKMLFWLALLGFMLLNGGLIAQAYYNNSKVQACFDSLSEKMSTADESAVLAKMDELFHLQYIEKQDFPDEFYVELMITSTGHGIEISSIYDVVIWPAGAVEAVNQRGEYEVDDLQGLDVLRHQLRIDLTFEPYAVSAVGGQ